MVDRVGDGEPLVLVHGGATTHRCFDLVADLLAEHFAVIRYDRRGHGGSGDGEPWSFAREVEDLLELTSDVDAGSGVCVLGYSFGGALALEAVRATSAQIHALVVYEPPFNVGGLLQSGAEVIALLDAGRLDAAAQLFITSTFVLGDAVVDAMRKHPLWQMTLDVIPNLRRELPVLAAAAPPTAPVPAPPTRVLVAANGGNPAFVEIAHVLETTFRSETVRIPGLPHFAMSTAPEAFAAAALDHFLGIHRSR